MNSLAGAVTEACTSGVAAAISVGRVIIFISGAAAALVALVVASVVQVGTEEKRAFVSLDHGGLIFVFDDQI